MKTLHRHFDDLVLAALPDASPLQKDEMRKAFFVGAHALFAELHKIEEPGVSEDEGVHCLTALREEVNEFFHTGVLSVVEGRHQCKN